MSRSLRLPNTRVSACSTSNPSEKMNHVSGFGAARSPWAGYCTGRQRAEVVVLAPSGRRWAERLVAHEGHRIDLRSVAEHFEMNVRPGGAPRRSNHGHRLAALDGVADRHEGLRVVGIACRVAV